MKNNELYKQTMECAIEEFDEIKRQRDVLDERLSGLRLTIIGCSKLTGIQIAEKYQFTKPTIPYKQGVKK